MTASSVGVLGPVVSWPSSLLLMSLLATKLESGGTCRFDNSKETISRELDKNFSKISGTELSRSSSTRSCTLPKTGYDDEAEGEAVANTNRPGHELTVLLDVD